MYNNVMLNEPGLTVFPETEQKLKALITSIDTPCLRGELVPACSFLAKHCSGMCCSLPVMVTQEEAGILTRLQKEKEPEFKNMGLRLAGPVVLSDAQNQHRYLTKKRRNFFQMNRIVNYLIFREKKSVLPDFKILSRFAQTCVFSLKDGACALQHLSEREGLHKWYYKPVNCWKFPLSVENGRLTLPQRRHTHFPCDQDPGVPIREGLKDELEFLGKILGRDILAEIR